MQVECDESEKVMNYTFSYIFALWFDAGAT